MMNDRFSIQLRQHLLRTANDRPAEGQLAAVVQAVSGTAQRNPLAARLTWNTARSGPFGSGAVRYGFLVVALAGAGLVAAGLLAGGPSRPTVFEGTWTSIDPGDGSTQYLVVAAGTSPAVRFVDEFAAGGACQADTVKVFTADGRGTVVAGDRLEVQWPDGGGCGLATVAMRVGTYIYDQATDSAIDGQKLTWSRVVGGLTPPTRAPVPGPTSIETPTPGATNATLVFDVTRVDGEVLRFTGEQSQGPGDLIAVHPDSGETRVLVKGLERVDTAAWSADGHWVSYQTESGPLWVVSSDQPPRQLANGDLGWVWSPKGSRLALFGGETLSVFDASTGQMTELATTEWTPVWSPDGTKLVFGERGGSIFSIDVRTGERSLLVRLPGENLDSVDEIEWSPDGTRLAILNDLVPGLGRLYVLNADGSGIRVLAEDVLVSGIDWSPDGTRIAFTESHGLVNEVNVWVAPADGSTASIVASSPVSSQPRAYKGGDPVWSPDGSQIGFRATRDKALVIDADGSSGVAPLDALTYQSWKGGWFACSTCFMIGYSRF